MKRIIFIIVLMTFYASLSFAGVSGVSKTGSSGSLKISIFPAPPDLTAKVELTEPSGNNILDADETGKLIITVQNAGKGDAFDVKAEIKANKNVRGLAFDRSLSFGTIAAGSTLKKELLLKAEGDVATDTLSFDIDIRETNGFDANPLRISFKTQSFQPPKLVIADIGIDDQNKNYKVEQKEIVEITARIQNVGQGDARNVRVTVLRKSKCTFCPTYTSSAKNARVRGIIKKHSRFGIKGKILPRC